VIKIKPLLYPDESRCTTCQKAFADKCSFIKCFIEDIEKHLINKKYIAKKCFVDGYKEIFIYKILECPDYVQGVLEKRKRKRKKVGKYNKNKTA